MIFDLLAVYGCFFGLILFLVVFGVAVSAAAGYLKGSLNA